MEDVRPDCVTDSILVKKYRELFAHLPHPWVVINRRASSWTPNKEWPSSKWVELIPRLKALGGVIEIGNPASDATANDELAHIDLVGKTTLTELAAVIAACDILVTPVSGPMHIAAATHTPAVVIYGGYEQASATAYQGNDNLVSIPSCSPCWLRGPCPIDKKCLQDISVDAVEQAILKVRDKMRRFSEREDAPPPVISAAGGNVDSRSFRRSADTTANMTTLHTRIDRRSASPERAACQKATEALMGTNTLTSNLKRRLWDWHGTEAHPAEWDGNVFGGGKISQRFWEYFVALEMLDLTPDSVVMDIGGGSPATGLSIFPRILAAAGVRVIVVDKDFGELKSDSVENASLEVGTADFETLVALLQKHQPTHLSCISVLEHAAYSQQRGIFDAIEKVFHGERAVFTLEFHETDCHWEQQLTTQTLSEAVSGLRRYYLDRIERSPMHCVNALTEGQRRWYPIALKFDPVRQFSYGR